MARGVGAPAVRCGRCEGWWGSGGRLLGETRKKVRLASSNSLPLARQARWMMSLGSVLVEVRAAVTDSD